MTTLANVDSARLAAQPEATAHTLRSRLRSRWVGPIVAIVGSVVLVVAGLLPVWGTRLIAPQYPGGLELWFFGDRVEGPVREVNGLNHYIGMQEIDLSRVPEMALWPLVIVGSALLLVIAVLWRGWLSRLALLGLWLVPVVVLADIQRWLVIFGTELDPRAALRLEGFIPLVVGANQVWNFSVLTYPGPALLAILGVALAATLARRAQPPEPRFRWLAAAISLATAVVGTAVLVPIGGVAASSATPEAITHAGHVGAAAEAAAAGKVDGGEPARYSGSNLQALIDGAPPGSTILVPPGDHRTHLVIDKPLTLIADGVVHLDGSGLGSVVTITADDVAVRGFHISGTGGQVEVAAGIKVVEADGVTIEDNHLEDFFHGIAVLGARDLRVVGNTLQGSGISASDSDHLVTGSAEHGHQAVAMGADPRSLGATDSGAGPQGQGDGIYLWNSEAATIRDNVIRDVRDGIYLSYVSDALVDRNRIERSRYAVHTMFGAGVTVFESSARDNLAGLVFMYTGDVLAGRNVLGDHRSGATGVGIVLKDVKGVRIAENVIERNRVGLRAEGTRRLSDAEGAILRNRFDSNDTAVSLSPSADLGFGANTFEGNLTDVHADDRGVARSNDWTYEGTGNRWAGYAGYDLDGDGVGDIPHATSGALQLLLADNPSLQLYRGSPALHALDSAQEIWEADRAVVMTDKAPRLHDHAPLARDLDPDSGLESSLAGEAGGWYVAGIALALLALLGATLLRARQRGADA
jgi:nitrous oxidase accessory protein